MTVPPPNPPSRPRRVLVADDFPAFRWGITSLLDRLPDFALAAQAATAQEVISGLEEAEPDVVTLDLGMPGVRGLDLLRRVRRERPALPVLVLSMHPERDVGLPCLRAGASGYVEKTANEDELTAALRMVASGCRYVSAALGEDLLDEEAAWQEREPVAHGSLSEREREVLERIALGQKPAEIARALGISTKTVQTYRGRVMQKLGLEGTADLVAYAIEHRLLGWRPPGPPAARRIRKR